MQQVAIKLMRDTSDVPRFETTGAAAVDLKADIAEIVNILPGETVKIPTGIAVALPDGWAGLVLPRSGKALQGLSVANAPGLIDCDYRGEVQVLAHNISGDSISVHPTDRIAQLMFVSYDTPQFYVVEKLSDTDRGEGGFGSTDACGRII